ncbi:PepSY-associated TM helix domain-containing protein [Stigmatella aurantiaca]|uniref:PepSY-associated TM helix domain protein n=1 Tax=Stigmatella aurantiaca (strain DW4/3-1) TaxID=378806 RepID=Q09A13_STIAD|nr:PepSY-associated TM helix domain-containing protein [Stigmatella aurantiaca]ADO68928.1 PepSY-associated TM helix domain protein [Stigmatella aurantiaca DW4/3-1]EAU68571.1 putative membrane protein [Stigmatella aurantiaca DW4/3-1]
MRLRVHTLLFWPHLVAGLLAGLIIGVMSFTGLALAFEHPILERADRETQQVAPPSPGTPRLPVDELIARVRAARPEAQPSAVTEYPDPTRAVTVSTGRTGGVYVNPYTGEVWDWGASGWRAFFHLMEDWHRWLGAQGDNRPVGKAITGASNALFFFLAVTGLYLWWPRKWTWRTLRPSIWFRRGLKGKARDWNWHNVTGFWLLPVLIVLTATGMVISYKGVSDLVFRLAGETPPTAGGPPPGPPIHVPVPPPGSAPLPLEALFVQARKQLPAWENITLRLSGGGAPRGNAPQAGPRPGGNEGKAEARKEGLAPSTFAIRETGGWPLFAATQVFVDPYTAQVLRKDAFADLPAGNRTRRWLRFLHTGEALGLTGQFVAALGCLGGLFLVWTGFCLSWRRFFPAKPGLVSSGDASTSE